MKRGRPKVETAPKMVHDRRADDAFATKCYGHLLGGSVPEPEFVFELMQRYLNSVRPKKLTSPEVAAMVDFWAVRLTSAKQAIEKAHRILDEAKSIEAIAKDHTRYGKREEQLDKERARGIDPTVDPLVVFFDGETMLRRMDK
jgi:hypothetical protein